MDKERIKETLENIFTNFHSEFDEIKNLLTQSPQAFDNTIWETVHSIYSVLLPVGYSLLALFFIIDFLNKSVHLEWMRWENVVKSLLKLTVAKLIMENSFMLLNKIFTITTYIIDKASKAGNYDKMSSLKDVQLTKLMTDVDTMGFMERLGFYYSLMPWSIAMFAIKIAILMIAYGRIIELYLLTAVSPLPLSTLAGEGTHHIAKRYLQVFIAVCLQGVVILIGIMIYGGLMYSKLVSGDITEMLIKHTLITMVLLLIFVKSGSWARQLTGVM